MDDLSNGFIMTWTAIGIEVERFACLYEFHFFASGMLCIAISRYDLFTFTNSINIWLGPMASIHHLSPPRYIANQMEMDIITEIRTLLGMQSNWHPIVAHMAYSGHISSAQQFRSLRGSLSEFPIKYIRYHCNPPCNSGSHLLRRAYFLFFLLFNFFFFLLKNFLSVHIRLAREWKTCSISNGEPTHAVSQNQMKDPSVNAGEAKPQP